jgi:hypothetical protein
MKTELVANVSYGRQEPRFERSTLSKDDERTKGRRLIYSPAHTARGSRTNPKTGKYGDGTWHEPESVSTGNYRFHAKGGKLDLIRKMPEEAISALEALDIQREDLQRQIYELNKKEREILAAAFDKSEPLRMHEIRGFKS